MEELQARHRKEQRDLQSKITQKKKNASRKTRKGINDECDALQRDLQERQQAELATLTQNVIVDELQALNVHDGEDEAYQIRSLDTTKQEYSCAGIQDGAEFTKIGVGAPAATSAPTVEGWGNKPNRQKARLARRAAEQKARAAQAAEEAANLPNLREQELAAMKGHLKRLGLIEITIRPDGHCMYSAVATHLTNEQLQSTNSDHSPFVKPYQLVRNTAGSFISNHPDDFAAFLEEPLDVYVSKIKDTGEWGGQLELQAVARAYDVDINVLQADGRIEKIESGSSPSQNPLWLAYYRHSYSLGEHYNALKKLG
jgi:OTU domain-containing protein 6